MPNSDAYWRETRRLTLVLLIFWLIMTFSLAWYAGDLNQVIVFGFPLGFYMAAQGVLLINMLIVWYYNRRMKFLDAKYGVKEG